MCIETERERERDQDREMADTMQGCVAQKLTTISTSTPIVVHSLRQEGVSGVSLLWGPIFVRLPSLSLSLLARIPTLARVQLLVSPNDQMTQILCTPYMEPYVHPLYGLTTHNLDCNAVWLYTNE